ncbi:MAG: archease [Thermodesulforhabdaceae bacterium]|jgi:SHS2 domain-containing protein
MGFSYLENMATADVAFKAWGNSLEELFTSCADALLAITVSHPENIGPAEERAIELKSDSLDLLLHNFLQEIIYFKDADQLLLKVRDISIESVDNPDSSSLWILKATLAGESLSLHGDDLLADVKAVTFHDFVLEKKDGRWEATVILDV